MARYLRVVLALAFATALSLSSLFSLSPTMVGTAYAAGTTETYVLLYRQNAVPADAAAAITRAGGTLVYAYNAIGVVIARSDNTAFRANLLQDTRIEGAAATGNFGTRIQDVAASDTGDLPNAPATDSDTLSGLQWDMVQMHTPEAHRITGGSRAVLVGDIDTGLDYTHPDLASNVDFANSVSCIGGVPNQAPAAWADVNGHGTHTAGTIAAASNGIGIVGVAPNVRIAGIKAGNDDGYFFPEAVICSFMWAGSHHMDVTNNSYFADPWLYNCRNDPGQRAIWKAEQRAIRYAQSQGVTVVAAMGNESDDLAHPTIDVISPDFPPGSEQEREVTNACLVIPVEIPGVIGVTADGNRLQDPADPSKGYLKSFYSTYGIGVAQVVAPGGDSVFGRTAAAINGRVLSTYPATAPCTRRVTDASVTPPAVYCYLQGTSMASPHVAGLAALVISRYGSSGSPQNGKMSPGAVQAYILQTADGQPCPGALPAGYEAFTRPDGTPQLCQGGVGKNGWYGSGQVNALKAVTR